MAILSKRHKPDNSESHNSLKISFTNIWGLQLNFIKCEFILKLNSDILALCETNLNDPIDSGNFSVRGYLPLIQKDSTTHMHDLAVYVYVKKQLLWLICRKLCGYLFVFCLALPLSITLFGFMHNFWCCFI